MPVIAADDVHRFYHARDDETRALRGVSFAVEAGEFVALVGPSGSGKSTLLSCLAGLDVPDGGQVVLNNERIARLPEPERARRRRAYIGILMQSHNLLFGLTAEENVQLPMILAGRPYRDRAASLLDQVGVAPRRRALPFELSGGRSGAGRAGGCPRARANRRLGRRTERRGRRGDGAGPDTPPWQSLRGGRNCPRCDA